MHSLTHSHSYTRIVLVRRSKSAESNSTVHTLTSLCRTRPAAPGLLLPDWWFAAQPPDHGSLSFILQISFPGHGTKQHQAKSLWAVVERSRVQGQARRVGLDLRHLTHGGLRLGVAPAWSTTHVQATVNGRPKKQKHRACDSL